MSSEVVIKNSQNNRYSHMAIALNELAGQINTDQSGLYKRNVKIASGDVTIDNSELDCEFYIPFDDDVEANEAEIVIYNITNKTINEFKKGNKITVTAGYNNDTGVIFSGYISTVKTKYEDCDKVTRVFAIDSEDRKERDIQSLSFSAGTKASYILKKLVNQLGLPVSVFKVNRDYTYKDSVSVDGGLMAAIKKYAQVCGVSAYICKSTVYVCPLNYKEGTIFNLSSDTGLISVAEFEESNETEEYNDTVKGYDCTMLLSHQVQTGSIVNIDSRDVKGTFRVREGTHNFDGDSFLTEVKVIEV